MSPVLLPTPQERPLADVVVYDGRCAVCTAQISRLARWDRRGRLSFLSLHDPEVARRYAELSHAELMRDMYVIDAHGKRYRGAAAVRHLTRVIPRLWWLAPLLHVPGSMPIWQWLYRQVAQRRYLFGRIEPCPDGSCEVHFLKR